LFSIHHGIINTLTPGLIQAVRKKKMDLTWLCAGISLAPVQVTDLVEVSKDAASLVVCTRKNFLVGGCRFLWVTS